MSDDNEIARPVRISRIEHDDGVEIGQWYWMKTKRYRRTGKHKSSESSARELLCVTHVGSNYVELSSVPEGTNHGSSTWRIHFKDFAAKCTLEPDAPRVINGFIEEHRQASLELIGEVQRITAALGVAPDQQLSIDGGSSDTQALVRVTTATPVKEYKKALQKAKEKTLPELFEKIEEENQQQAQWMMAQILPFEARIGTIEPIVEAINARVLNVELYAGLVEEVVQVRDGEPAAYDAQLHLMQRRHYMDEESLLAYRAGGMDYKRVEDFDKWIAKDKHMRRILPFDRCVVAFRIRRSEKERDPEKYGGGIGAFIRIGEEMREDKRTFIYLRNGERLYRLATELKFKRKLFPDLDAKDVASGNLYAKEGDSYYDDDGDELSRDERKEWHIVTENKWKAMCEADAEEALASAAYEQAKKDAKKNKQPEPKYQYFRLNRESRDYHLWTPDSVYYDDIKAQLAADTAEHNRLAIVLQGLLDRSPVFHPHPKWELWTVDGFEAAVRLVYDDSRALSAGKAPDFEAYRARLNAKFKAGSYSVGQREPWLEHEIEKENERRANSWRYKSSDNVSKWWRPQGNDGPDIIAKVDRFSKQHGCQFKWTRERQRSTWRHEYGEPLPCRFVAPTNRLLNVSAYTPGDYLIFYADPRTRAEYLKWAPLLLAAEDWHAGKTTKKENDDDE